MRISDWSSDVCSSDLPFLELNIIRGNSAEPELVQAIKDVVGVDLPVRPNTVAVGRAYALWWLGPDEWLAQSTDAIPRSEEHTSELQSLMRSSYAGFCWKKKTTTRHTILDRPIT